MYKHLFLEADSGAGKSTLIRELITPYVDDIGGFSSQRLLDDNNETIAFRIVSADDLRLAVPYEETPETIFRTISKDHSSMSMPGVFGSAGIDLLDSCDEKKLILLDEIGGLELKDQSFKDRLYELLAGDVPCIGVIKQLDKARSMNVSADAGEKPSSIASLNQELRRKMLEDLDCKILEFKRNDPAIIDEVKDFIDKIFT